MNLKQEHKIKHLSIEGFDGVGKTTVCEILKKELNLNFITKPFHLLSDENNEFNNYINIRNKINMIQNHSLSSWFYCFSYAYCYNLKTNIITDRFYGSNYAWGGNKNNLDIYELCMKKFGKPDLTIILYATNNVIEQRIKTRNKNDHNLNILDYSHIFYEKLKEFLDLTNCNYLWIDTSKKDLNSILKKIIDIWKKI